MYRFRLSEHAVVLALSYLLPMHETVNILISIIESQPSPSAAGSWFEYLVSYSAVKKWSGAYEVNVRCYPGSLNEYLNPNCKPFPDYFFKPDDRCGPDFIYRLDMTVWLVQVELVDAFGPKKQQHKLLVLRSQLVKQILWKCTEWVLGSAK